MNRLCKVLIVDDEFLVRQGIKHHMNWEAEGFQIVGEASNGEEGLEQVHLLQPDIVITDIVMPVMDGETFVRTLKASHPQIEVIVLSSFSEFEYVRSTLQNGAADYILKPKLDTNELLQVLQRTAGKIPELQFEPSHDGWRLGQLMEKMLSGFTLDEENEMHMIRRLFLIIVSVYSYISRRIHKYICTSWIMSNWSPVYGNSSPTWSAQSFRPKATRQWFFLMSSLPRMNGWYSGSRSWQARIRKDRTDLAGY